MLDFEVSVKLEGIKEALEQCDPKKVQVAAASAIMKTANQTKTYAAKIIREEFNVPAGRVKQFLKVYPRETSGRVLQTVIEGRGLGMPLSYFGPKQTGVQVSKRTGFRYTKKAKGSDGRRRGGVVTVEVKKGKRQGPEKFMKHPTLPFLTIMKSGHIGVFQRIPGTVMYNKNKEQIQQLMGPGVGGLFGSKLFMPRITKFVNDKFEPIFKHELEWRLTK